MHRLKHMPSVPGYPNIRDMAAEPVLGYSGVLLPRRSGRDQHRELKYHCNAQDTNRYTNSICIASSLPS